MCFDFHLEDNKFHKTPTLSSSSEVTLLKVFVTIEQRDTLLSTPKIHGISKLSSKYVDPTTRSLSDVDNLEKVEHKTCLIFGMACHASSFSRNIVILMHCSMWFFLFSILVNCSMTSYTLQYTVYVCMYVCMFVCLFVCLFVMIFA